MMAGRKVQLGASVAGHMRRSCQLCAQPPDLGRSEDCGHVHDAAFSAEPPESRRLKKRGTIQRRHAVEVATTTVRGGVARNDNAVADARRVDTALPEATVREAAFDPLGAGDVDPFAGDVDAWLGWLMDCVAIETAIRRRR